MRNPIKQRVGEILYYEMDNAGRYFCKVIPLYKRFDLQDLIRYFKKLDNSKVDYMVVLSNTRNLNKYAEYLKVMDKYVNMLRTNINPSLIIYTENSHYLALKKHKEYLQ